MDRKSRKTERGHNVLVLMTEIVKSFRIPHKKKSTLFEEVTSLGEKTAYEKFFAIKKLSLNIHEGEFIGIIGNNGSGKSTLLKLIAGILVPSKGGIMVDGRVATFLELGAGFQLEITARENLFLYGAIMGMGRREVQRQYKKIVSFAELEKFMDAKLSEFSSGMRARLAFSIAIHSKFDILLVDEALAVGDQKFRKKCYEVFRQFKKSSKTVLFVSHEMDEVRRFCTRGMVMHNGKLIFDGTVDRAISVHMKTRKSRKT